VVNHKNSTGMRKKPLVCSYCLFNSQV